MRKLFEEYGKILITMLSALIVLSVVPMMIYRIGQMISEQLAQIM